MEWFDTHAHLDDEQFDATRDQIMANAHQAGVRHVLAVGTTAESSRRCLELAALYAGVCCAVGIQPNYCAEAGPADWPHIVELASRPSVVALGETGLDRYWDHTPFDVQQDFFERHVRLAQQHDLPLVIHMRDCSDEMLSTLGQARRQGALRGVMHSFTGDIDTAARCVELGLHISFAGMVTYKKSDELRGVAASIPADRLLLETDAPYLSPHPARGRRPNEPALIVHTARCLADLRRVSLETLAAQTTQNARRLFKVA